MTDAEVICEGFATEMSNPTHECSVCHVRSEWGPGWSWYGSVADTENGNPVVKACSERCRKQIDVNGPEFYGYREVKYRRVGSIRTAPTKRVKVREYVPDYQI